MAVASMRKTSPGNEKQPPQTGKKKRGAPPGPRTYDPAKHCGAQRTGEPPGTLCKRGQGEGTDHPGIGHCKWHLGSTESHKVAAQRELQQRAAERYGLPVDVDPATAMLRHVAYSYGQVLYMRRIVHDLGEDVMDGDKPHVAWQMLKVEERQHAAVCRDAAGADVSRRAIELAEDTARQLAAGMMAFAQLLGHDPEDAGVRRAGREALQLVAGGHGDA